MGFQMRCGGRRWRWPLWVAALAYLDRLIAQIRTEEAARKILAAMHPSTEVPQLQPAHAAPTFQREAGSREDWMN